MLRVVVYPLALFLLFCLPIHNLFASERCDTPKNDTPKSDDSCLCSGEGHLEGIRFRYRRGECSDSYHSQGDYFRCSGSVPDESSVYIIAATRSERTHKKTKISFEGLVTAGTTFFLDGTATKHEKVSPQTFIWIYDLSGNILQSLEIHTSCSLPLDAGDTFGSLEVVGALRNGVELIDECGVCGGDGSTCIDCAGIAGGSTTVDTCGVCGGTNACIDCAGDPNGAKTFDGCGVCGGDGTSCLDCNGVPGGTADIDSCGVCGGDNACLDCAGIPFGTATFDDCGVCNGNNECEGCLGSTCDCFGVIGGSAVLDSCGVCGGDGACLDCNGVPNGNATNDACGVCNGKNDCLDCAGKPFGEAALDQCGVCNGDGTTCEVCTHVNLDAVRGSLDGGGLALKHIVYNLVRQLSRKEKRRERKYYRKVRELAGDYYLKLWTLAYTFPEYSYQCEQTTSCITRELSSEKEAYTGHLETMTTLFMSVGKRFKRGNRKNGVRKRDQKRYRSLKKQFDLVQKKTFRALEQIPQETWECGGGS